MNYIKHDWEPAANRLVSLQELRDGWRREDEEINEMVKRDLEWLAAHPDGELDEDEEDENVPQNDEGSSASGDEEEDSEIDDYDLGVSDEDWISFSDIYLGDEIEGGWEDDERTAGIVVDRILNGFGIPVCYKIWRHMGEDWHNGGFDFIQAKEVTFSEWCGDTGWSLARIGYHLVKETVFGTKTGEAVDAEYYVNSETGDVAYPW